jgi:hypothetical protein
MSLSLRDCHVDTAAHYKHCPAARREPVGEKSANNGLYVGCGS